MAKEDLFLALAGDLRHDGAQGRFVVVPTKPQFCTNDGILIPQTVSTAYLLPHLSTRKSI